MSNTKGRKATTRQIMGSAALCVGDPTQAAPPGWTWKLLSSIADMASGHTPSRAKANYWGGDVPWLSIRDAKRHHGGTVYETAENTNAEGLANSSARLLPTGTVCLSRTASVGYVVILGTPMATSQDFANWTCSNELEPRFLQYLLLAERESLAKFSSGAVHQTIYYPELKALQVCIPEPDEQKRIIAQLDALSLRFKQLKATYEKQIEQLFQLESAALSSAFSGQLPRQFRAVAEQSDPKIVAFAIAYAEHLHRQVGQEKTFGRVKAQKSLHLVEAIGRIDLGRQPMKDAAGPNDFKHMLRAEDWAKREAFFRFDQKPDGVGYDFVRLPQFDAVWRDCMESLGHLAPAIERAVKPIVASNSQDAEIFTTTLAAWNNLILDGETPADDRIITEARDDWHPSKLNIPVERFRQAIARIRSLNLVPDGTAKRVVGQSKLL